MSLSNQEFKMSRNIYTDTIHSVNVDEINGIIKTPFITAVGIGALAANTSGLYNTAIGADSMQANTTGVQNTAIGAGSMQQNTSGCSNTGVGVGSMQQNTTGTNNVAVGDLALLSNYTGSQNTAVGTTSMMNTSGDSNSAFGYGSLLVNKSGTDNVAIGCNALLTATASNNTAIGSLAGYSAERQCTIGDNNTFIGYQAGHTENTTISDTIILGNSSIARLKCKQQNIFGLSDKRDKADIKDIDSSLNLITELKPVMFKWDQRSWYEGGISDGSKKKEKIETGFLAQDLKELEDKYDMKYLNLTLTDNPECMESSYGNLLMPLIKAFQELTDLVKTQKKQTEDMLADIKNFKDIIDRGV